MKNRYHLLERRKKLTGLLLAAPVLSLFYKNA